MRGFTLLELVVASLLAAILAAATAAVMMRGFAASRQADGSLQQLRQLERAADRLADDLHNAVALADQRPQGSPQELQFSVSAGPTDLVWVHYRLSPAGRGSALVREWQPMIPDAPPAQSATLIPEGVDFSVVYGMISTMNGRPSLTWSERWENPLEEPAALPRIVRVRLQSSDPKGRMHSITRELLIPQGVLKEQRA